VRGDGSNGDENANHHIPSRTMTDFSDSGDGVLGLSCDDSRDSRAKVLADMAGCCRLQQARAQYGRRSAWKSGDRARQRRVSGPFVERIKHRQHAHEKIVPGWRQSGTQSD
jgi:hypothetical protein